MKQSPTNASSLSNKVCSATNRKFEKIEKDFGQIKNIKLDSCKVYKNDQNVKPKPEKSAKNITPIAQNVKYSKKEYMNKTNSKVLDLLRMEMKKRQEEKSKSRSKNQTKRF